MTGNDRFSRSAPGRPRGTIRQALGAAGWELLGEGAAGFTWRDLAQRAQVGFSAARITVVHMASAGELQRCGLQHAPHARRPMTLYAPADTGTTTAPALDALLRTWSR